ncbi:hypothetical protein ESCO_006606 [Escovopsis weberi]|uniref:Uncharacterized protein n=1 Tax=Escovopsis weberi TaxID=150374 RepID=A0A0M8N9B5_ESCWE|nr:hypothetical protein ESCO_006606 [Escovopsis weberi]
MNEPTGQGWSQHMVHGTARALEASGPARCRSGSGRAFFIQARVFEISRTILFDESSFLTQPAWMRLSREMQNNDKDGDGWRPLDSLLDIMVMCSRLGSVLRSRYVEIMDLEAPTSDQALKDDDRKRVILSRNEDDGQPAAEARSVYEDGHALREALDGWYAAYGNFENSPGAGDDRCKGEGDDSTLVSRVFFAAISIYLSGIFDYGITCWKQLGLEPPTLDDATIQAHLSGILRSTRHALQQTTLSPLLFLFPLRIAGARARSEWQRERVLELIGTVEKKGGFAAAGAVSMELQEIWQLFGVGRIATDQETLEY